MGKSTGGERSRDGERAGVPLLDDVRKAAEARRKAQARVAELDAELRRRIRLAHSEGISYTKIAAAAGLSLERIRQITNE